MHSFSNMFGTYCDTCTATDHPCFNFEQVIIIQMAFQIRLFSSSPYLKPLYRKMAEKKSPNPSLLSH